MLLTHRSGTRKSSSVSITSDATLKQAAAAPKLIFEAQGHYVQIKWSIGSLSQRVIRATRGAVTAFSRKSRKRLLELCARLDLAQIVREMPVIFITLTYAAQFPSTEQSKQHLRAFLERIRRFAPDASGIWRIEYQERGAPHYHLILFNLPFLPKRELTAMWGEIVGLQYWDNSQALPRPPMTRIEAIRSPRKAMAYVSKYVAKSDSDSGSDSGFNDVPYLHAGRWWGVFNREKLQFAEALAIVLTLPLESLQQVLFQYRRLMAKKYYRANRYGRLRGASLFVDSSRCWHDAFLWAINEYS